jgi:hypothetical protein
MGGARDGPSPRWGGVRPGLVALGKRGVEWEGSSYWDGMARHVALMLAWFGAARRVDAGSGQAGHGMSLSIGLESARGGLSRW